MKNLRSFLAVLLSVTAAMTSAVSCSIKDKNSVTESSIEPIDESSVSDAESEIINENKDDISGQTIYWLADYDINPSNGGNRPVALSLFEDIYGAKVEYIKADPNEKFATLSERILSGKPVDMFPYESEALPNGVAKELYQPLDDYYDILEMDTELWDDMTGIIDMFEYKDAHYVIPYRISDPVLITYSRKLMRDEELDDPYELYLEGKWDWDAMMEMMDTFVSNTPDDKKKKTKRYGISGWFGQAVFQSTGHTVVGYENGQLKNNIGSPEIEKAGLFMEELASKKLYNSEWTGNFPDDMNTLFYGMSDWTLGASNAANEKADLMIVPFPKASGADKNYITCNFDAKMLAKGSDKGKAVATYIKCERLAATNEKYKDAAKQAALEAEETVSGKAKSFITEEQYDALQSYLDTENVTPVFDFAYGMGEKMYGTGEYTYETKGVMNNLEEALLEGNKAAGTWEELRDKWTDVIQEEVDRLNG